MNDVRVPRLPARAQTQDVLPTPPKVRSVGVYDSPRSMLDEESRHARSAGSGIAAPMSAKRRNHHVSREPSPPSLRDLPPLVHSAKSSVSSTGRHRQQSSTDSSASRSSSLAPSSRSSSVAPSTRSLAANTPQTLGYYDNEKITFAIADQHYSPSSSQLQAAEYTSAGYYYSKPQAVQSMKHLPTMGAITALPMPGSARPGMKGHQISFSTDSQQPSKKVKAEHNSSSSVTSVVSNFWKSATGGYRVGRTPLQTAVA